MKAEEIIRTLNNFEGDKEVEIYTRDGVLKHISNISIQVDYTKGIRLVILEGYESEIQIERKK